MNAAVDLPQKSDVEAGNNIQVGRVEKSEK